MTNSQRNSRRWTVIGSGLLCAALAFVVIYTGPRSFHSPLALVVVAAIGLAAVLLQRRFRSNDAKNIHVSVWFNLLGVALALAALFADLLHLSVAMFQAAALGAVGCFSISSVLILEAMRKQRVAQK